MRYTLNELIRRYYLGYEGPRLFGYEPERVVAGLRERGPYIWPEKR